jgi:hypothetical protein
MNSSRFHKFCAAVPSKVQEKAPEPIAIKTNDTFSSELEKAFEIPKEEAAAVPPGETSPELPGNINVLPQIEGNFIPPSPPGAPEKE